MCRSDASGDFVPPSGTPLFIWDILGDLRSIPSGLGATLGRIGITDSFARAKHISYPPHLLPSVPPPRRCADALQGGTSSPLPEPPSLSGTFWGTYGPSLRDWGRPSGALGSRSHSLVRSTFLPRTFSLLFLRRGGGMRRGQRAAVPYGNDGGMRL